MEDVFAAVDARPKRRQGVTGQTIEAQMRGTMCQITEYELDTLRDEITRLTAELREAEDRANRFATKEMHTEARVKKAELERDQALARVAAAYEAAASVLEDRGSDGWAENLMAEWSSVYAESIRDLTPADAQATLDKLLAEARLEGWRAGRDQAHVGLAAVQREVAQFSATHGNIGPKEASHD